MVVAGSAMAWLVVVPALAGAQQAGPTFAVGDVLVAMDGAQVQWRRADGTLVETLAVGSGQNAGMAFDDDGNLYVTDFSFSTVNAVAPDRTSQGPFGSGYDSSPESIVFDAGGNVYVGQADGTGDILKFDSSGNPVQAFDVETEDRGSDWIELAGDQCTIFYTSEGSTIFRYDVCSDEQGPVFLEGLPGSAAYALRILPDGGVLVADTEQILRVDASGETVQTYDTPGQDSWFALNLDPDGESFWSAGLGTGDVFRFDLDSGEVLLQFSAGEAVQVGGLAVFGELTAAVPTGSLFSDSLRAPSELTVTVAHVVTNVAIAAAVVVLLPFPAELFNSTMEANYDEVMGWFRRRRRKSPGAAPGDSPTVETHGGMPPAEPPTTTPPLSVADRVRALPKWVPWVAVVLFTALLYCFLDPSFGFDRASLALYLGILAGLVLVTVAFGGFELLYVRTRRKARGAIRAYAGSLPVAVACVIVSRVAKFQPGYLYGFIAQPAYEEELSAEDEGRKIASTAGWMLLLSAAAYVGRIPVHETASGSDAPIWALILDAALVTFFVAGLEATALGLFPLRFLDGSKLRAWNQVVWIVLFGVSVLAFVYILINPVSGYLGRAPAITALLLLLGFGLFSTAFWAYFRYRKPKVPGAPTGPRPAPEAAWAPGATVPTAGPPRVPDQATDEALPAPMPEDEGNAAGPGPR
jgi:hypothetical protein